MSRFALAVLAGVGVAATAGPAAAQFYGATQGGYRPPALPAGYGTPGNFSYLQTRRLVVAAPLGFNLDLQKTVYGPAGYWAVGRYYRPRYAAAYTPQLTVPTYSGYMSGGVKNPAVDQAARDLARAQRQAQARVDPVAARTAIYDEYAYERLGANGLPALRPGADPTEALRQAVAAASEAEVASGEALNALLVAAVAADPKGAAKAESVYLPPLVLGKLRFRGGAADAVNRLREAGRLDFPAAFDAPPLAGFKAAVEKEFAAAAAPALAGRAADPGKLAVLEGTVGKARAALEPAVQNMGFEEAVAARRFLNQLDATAKALRGPGSAGLVDPRWAGEGVATADLVRYMTRNKLLFAPAAARGDEDAYLAAHRGLVAYLFTLSEAAKPPAKK